MEKTQFELLMEVLLDILWHITRPNDRSLLDWEKDRKDFLDWKKREQYLSVEGPNDL